MKPKATLLITVLTLFFSLATSVLFAQTDTIAPVITLVGRDTVPVALYDTYKEPGVYATDNQDTVLKWDTAGNFYVNFPNGQLTKLGIYQIHYIVTDKSGNQSIATRWIMALDTIPPTVTLKSDSVKCANVDDNYKDEEFVVVDNYSNWPDFTVVVEGDFVSMGTTKPGCYKMRYKVSDQAGNVGYSGWRHIIVHPKGYSGPCEYNADTCTMLTSGIAGRAPWQESIKAYPMPCRDVLSLTLPASLAYTSTALPYQIYSMEGKAVMRGSMSPLGAQASIATGFLAKGMYMLQLYDKGTVYRLRFVKN